MVINFQISFKLIIIDLSKSQATSMYLNHFEEMYLSPPFSINF